MINLVIFGLGRAGKIHYQNAFNSELFKIKYVVDVQDISNYVDKEIEVVNFKDDKMISNIMNDSSVHAIIIASPTDTHYTLIKLAIKYNKHIFVEKPIVSDYQQIKECFELAEQKKLKLFVGYNRRYDPKIMEIKGKIDNNEIGFVNYALTISRDYPYPNQKFLKVSSGIFNDCATHDIDYLNTHTSI